MDRLDVSYPDTMGFLGGFLFGVPISFTLFLPTTGTLKTAPRRDRGFFFCGLISAFFLFIICVAAFATGDPKVYYYME